ncbi:MAG: hypothetical protein RR416_03365 [Clostridia bacterium]
MEKSRKTALIVVASVVGVILIVGIILGGMAINAVATSPLSGRAVDQKRLNSALGDSCIIPQKFEENSETTHTILFPHTNNIYPRDDKKGFYPLKIQGYLQEPQSGVKNVNSVFFGNLIVSRIAPGPCNNLDYMPFGRVKKSNGYSICAENSNTKTEVEIVCRKRPQLKTVDPIFDVNYFELPQSIDKNGVKVTFVEFQETKDGATKCYKAVVFKKNECVYCIFATAESVESASGAVEFYLNQMI